MQPGYKTYGQVKIQCKHTNGKIGTFVHSEGVDLEYCDSMYTLIPWLRRNRWYWAEYCNIDSNKYYPLRVGKN